MRFHSKVSKMSKVRKMVFIAMLIALALVLSYFEKMIPLNLTIQGAKLGLSNIVTLTSLFFLTLPEAFILVILRVILGAIFVGSVSGFLYSLAGGLLSFFVMYFLVNTAKNFLSIISISVVGAITHNIGQVIMASFIIENFGIIVYYLPQFFLTGIITGILVGFVVKYLLEYLKQILT